MNHVYKGVSGRKYPPKSVMKNARVMRKLPTPAEKKLWNAVRRRQIEGLYFRRQRPVGSFIVDFYCEEKRLGIEIDGGIHQNPQQALYDRAREEFLEFRGVRMIRFSNEDVLNKLEKVVNEIRRVAAL